MEHYEKKISFLGENIQTIRKHRGMKQQELADKIGINMQSLSKIERGVNYPTFDTLEKIMDVLGVTPNELLSGEWKYVDHTEPYIMDIIKREQDFNVSLDYLSENEFFDNENEYRFYMETILIRYISNYLSNEVVEIEELMERLEKFKDKDLASAIGINVNTLRSQASKNDVPSQTKKSIELYIENIKLKKELEKYKKNE
jgi:transcriptional regulator with XRE-family HTH domain